MSFWGSITGSDAIKDAAKENRRATQAAIAAQREAGSAAEGYYKPYRDTGLSAWDKLAAIAGLKGAAGQQEAFDAYRESPDVAFRKKMGIQAIDRSAAAAGGLKGGRTLAALDEFGQGLAEQGFDNYKGDLRYINDMGYGATSGSANARLGTGANIAGLTMQGGQTAANLAMAGGQIIPNLLTGVASIGGDIFGRWLEGRNRPQSPYGGPTFGGSSYTGTGAPPWMRG